MKVKIIPNSSGAMTVMLEQGDEIIKLGLIGYYAHQWHFYSFGFLQKIEGLTDKATLVELSKAVYNILQSEKKKESEYYKLVQL